MKLIPSFGEISAKTSDAFKRFPITISWAIIATLFCLFTIEIESESLFFMKLIFTFALGISWLIAARFFEEHFNSDKEWIMLLPIAFLALFYWQLPDTGKELGQVHITRFILYFFAGHLLVLVAPFLLKWEKSAYFNYLKSVFIAIVRSLFFSLILYLGIVLALLAIKHLFNVDFDGKRFFQIFVICIGTINTWIYLSDFPKKIHQQTKVNYTKPMEVLVKYILIPLVILYLVILYAYAFKILLNWNLPKGWVSYLVIALSLLGFVIQMLINPIQKTIDSRPIKRFYPWFYILLLPLIVLLFVAIFRRVSEYGITENRYFVLTLAIWILAMTLYMLISKKKKIRVFPLTLSVVALFISFGFWGAFSVSSKSQIKQFKKVFSEIKNNNFTTTYQKKRQLQSIVRYLSDKEETDKISKELGYNPEEVFEDKNRWSFPNKIIDSLKIKIDNPSDNVNDVLYGNGYRSFYLNESNLTYATKNYDYFKRIRLEDSNNKEIKIKGYSLFFNAKNNAVTISNKEDKTEIVDLKPLINNLISYDKRGNITDKNLMTIKKEFDNFNIKFVFNSINSREINGKKNSITYANGFVFIKEKE